jgi:hypothetical protein
MLFINNETAGRFVVSLFHRSFFARSVITLGGMRE